MLPGFEPRQAQRAMAATVAATLQHDGVAMVEAGTGTGKTLAYLIPAILSGKRVLVSTGTKNLQEQIVDKDLPVLTRVLDRPFTATVMKGRSNYLCLHRYQAMRSGGLPRQQRLGGFGHPGTEVDERILLPILERWVARTTTGDRAELRDLPDDLPIWSELSASAENCLGTTCPQFNECYVTQMRQRAADSDLVIVNHHLLFADAAVRQGNYGAVIPDRDVAILDEAHQLEDVATNYFGLSVSNYRIDDLTRDIERALDAWPAPERRDAVKRMTARVEDRARHFFDALQPRRRTGEDRVRVTPDALTDVQPLGQALIGTLEGVEAQLQLLKSAPSDEAGAVRPAVLDDLIALAARVAELRQELTVLLRACDPDFVFFLETRGRGLFLRAAPIDVSRIVRDAGRGPLQGHGADLGDAGRGWRVRLRAWPAGHPGRRGGAAALGVRLRAAGHSLPAQAHAAAARPRVCRRRGPRVPRDSAPDARARLRPLHQLRHAARRGATAAHWAWRIRCWCRAPPRAARCSTSSAARRTPCSWRRRASGRASMSSATS